jgi:hypothetical protein
MPMSDFNLLIVETWWKTVSARNSTAIGRRRQTVCETFK